MVCMVSIAMHGLYMGQSYPSDMPSDRRTIPVTFRKDFSAMEQEGGVLPILRKPSTLYS